MLEFFVRSEHQGKAYHFVMKIARSKKLEAGFTLIELMVVIVILGLLAGIIVPRLIGRTEEAKRTKAAVQIRNLEAALDLFRLDNGFYPSTEQGLVALVSKPTVGTVPANYRDGGYIKKIPLDPWGNPYVYISPGNHGDYDVISYGADGQQEGEGINADIKSWEIE